MTPDEERQLLSNIAWVAERDATSDEIGAVFDAVDSLYEKAKALRDAARAAAVEHIEATSEPLVIGGKTWLAKHERETKCTDNLSAYLALLYALEGDEAAVIRCLSANAWKPGTCRTVLDADTFDSCFRTEEKVRLVEGKPRKTLVQAWEK